MFQRFRFFVKISQNVSYINTGQHKHITICPAFSISFQNFRASALICCRMLLHVLTIYIFLQQIIIAFILIGISPTIYNICLTDAELLRLSSNLTVEEIRQLAIHLGISNVKLDEIGQDFSRNSSMVKFASLRTCSDNNKLCGDFMKAITTAGLNKHTMCMVYYC